MSRKIDPLIDVVRLEDKETKLKSFIRMIVEHAPAGYEATAQAAPILLVARSLESPVAKAVAALVREGVITGPVKCILALAPRQDQAGEISQTMAALIGSHGGRILRDIRMFDAHEQLVLGPAACWVGDCMRRDPMKRDAYECFAADCSKTAEWARKSFDRLWSVCEALPEELLSPAPLPQSEACPPPAPTGDAPADRTTSG